MPRLRYIQNPNCPVHQVQHVLIGSKYRQLYNDFFESHGIIPIYVEDNSDVDLRLSGHVDLSVFHLGNNRLIVSPAVLDTLRNSFNTHGLTMECYPADNQNEAYPNDCGLNVCYSGKYIIYNKKTADKNIVNYLTNNNVDKEIIINQGYSKCNICIVDSNSIITGDPGIALKCRELGLDVLMIHNEDIHLNGFNYGFIGGCSFKMNQNELVFTGRFKNNNDEEQINHFLNKRGINITYMSNQIINDIGGVLPITEITEE